MLGLAYQQNGDAARRQLALRSTKPMPTATRPLPTIVPMPSKFSPMNNCANVLQLQFPLCRIVCNWLYNYTFWKNSIFLKSLKPFRFPYRGSTNWKRRRLNGSALLWKGWPTSS